MMHKRLLISLFIVVGLIGADPIKAEEVPVKKTLLKCHYGGVPFAQEKEWFRNEVAAATTPFSSEELQAFWLAKHCYSYQYQDNTYDYAVILLDKWFNDLPARDLMLFSCPYTKEMSSWQIHCCFSNVYHFIKTKLGITEQQKYWDRFLKEKVTTLSVEECDHFFSFFRGFSTFPRKKIVDDLCAALKTQPATLALQEYLALWTVIEDPACLVERIQLLTDKERLLSCSVSQLRALFELGPNEVPAKQEGADTLLKAYGDLVVAADQLNVASLMIHGNTVWQGRSESIELLILGFQHASEYVKNECRARWGEILGNKSREELVSYCRALPYYSDIDDVLQEIKKIAGLFILQAYESDFCDLSCHKEKVLELLYVMNLIRVSQCDPQEKKRVAKAWIDAIKHEKEVLFFSFAKFSDLSNSSSVIRYAENTFLNFFTNEDDRKEIFEYLMDAMPQLIDPTLELLIEKSKKVTAEKGPLFSSFTIKNISQIASLLGDLAAEKISSMRSIMEQLIFFTEEEYAKEKIVFFHGQHAQWAFLEKVYNGLIFIKYGLEKPEGFVHLRFMDMVPMQDFEAQLLRKLGLGWNSVLPFHRYRPRVLFANLHFFANQSGSNSFSYVATNSDQSAWGFIEDWLDYVFTCFWCKDSYDQLIQEDSALFTRLFEEYTTLVKESGNVGRFIAISLPKPVAQRLAYSTTSGAPLKDITINGQGTTDVVKIAENFDQVPFNNEYCIILSREICNPSAARNAGVIIRGFDALDRASEAFKKFEAEFDQVMQKVAEKYKERTPGITERVHRYIKELSGLAIHRQKKIIDEQAVAAAA